MNKLLHGFLVMIAFILIISDFSTAQPNYNFSATQGAYTPIVGGMPFVWRVTSSPNDEDFTFPLTIVSPTGFGAPFIYDGVPFSEIQVSCNGFLKFVNVITGDTLSTSKTTAANNNLRSFTRNVLAPLWDDLAVNNAITDIDYQFTGPGGNRVLTIEWRNVYWNWTAPLINANFQIRLYEINNWIEFHYGAFPNAPAGASASIGMNDGTPISSTTSGVEATGTFLSINFGGTPGTRTFHRSYGYEYSGISSGPDPVGPLPALTTLFQFIPQVPVPLAPGNYTIGGPIGPSNFLRLSDAAEALNLNGISGPVTFNIFPGPDPNLVWDDIFHLIPIMGSSVNNTITVQNDPQNPGVKISPRNGITSTNAPSATVGDAMIRLDGTCYTTIGGTVWNGIVLFDNPLNLTTAAKYEMGIFLGNAIVTTFNNPAIITGARFNTFKNLYINMQATTNVTNGGAIGIRFGTNGPNADQNQTNSFNTIQDCEIEQFYRSAVYMFGFSSAVPDVGNTITAMIESANYFHNATLSVNIQDCRVIEAYDQKNLLIEKTDIFDIIATALVTNGVWGIRVNPSATDGTSGTLTIRNCKIYNIENQGAQVTSGFACGIEVTSPYHEGIVDIYDNKVHDIYSNGSTTCRAVGMQLSLGAGGNSALNVYNNYIYDLRAPRSTSTPGVRGLDVQSLNNVLTASVYYNTVFLDNAVPPTVQNHYSACLYWANFGTSSLDLRNNILINRMSAGTAPTTGVASSLYTSANSNLLRLALTTNNNLFESGSVPTTNKPIAFDNVIPYVTLSAYQSAVATGGLGGPRDAQAVTEYPPFIQPINPIFPPNLAYDLHLTAAPTVSQAESGALPVTPVVTDWDGNARNPNFPDIGADEYNGATVADIIPPQILYTPLPNQQSLVPPSLVVTITDRSGIPGGSPTLWLKRTIDAAFIPTPGVPGPGPNDYTFPFAYAFPAPPVAIGDVIQYYVGAQDGAPIPGPNVGTNPTGGSGLPPGVVPPPIFNTFTIDSLPIASGTYTVGITKFNQLTGKNLYPKTFTEVVKERVRVERNLEIKNSLQNESPELIDLSLTVPGIDRDYSFDSTKYSPTEFVMKDVVREYVQLMDNGEVYKGPFYIDVTKEDLERVGVNTEGMEDIRGMWASLTIIVNEINKRGISGPVTLSLVDNAYNTETYPIELKTVAGVSPANTITIKPAAGTNPVFTTTAGATGVALLKIINTSYVTIDGSNTVGGTTKNLTFNNIRTGTSQGIWVGSLGTTPVTNLTIKNCAVSTGETSGSTPIMISDGTTAGNSGYFTNITIQNDSLFKGRQGIYINGGVIPQYGNNIMIEDNSLNTSGANQLKLYGIYSQGCNGVSIKNNDVGNFEAATSENDRGIWIAAGTINAAVEKNKVHDIGTIAAGNGGNGIVVSSSSTNCNNIIKNNFIYNITGTGLSSINANPLGIYLFGAQTGLGVYNNSIYLTGALLNTAAVSAAFSCGVCISSGTYADVRNNVIYNKLGQSPASASTNGAMGVFAFTTLAQFTSLDNNVYILNPSLGSKSFGHINGLGYLGFNQTFTKWKTNSGLDANSFNSDPKFVNALSGDLHIKTTTGTPCESGGVPILSVTDDIDGNLRNVLTPDIGADEFNGTKFMTLNLTALIQGFYNGTINTPDTMKVQIRNVSSPYAIIDSAYAVINSAGVGSFNFRDPVVGTNYLIGTSHRNALVTSNNLAGNAFSGAWALSYDFTSAQSQANGSNLVQVGTKWCIYVGNVNRDGVIDITDVSAVDTDNLNFVFGYTVTDLNGDNIVDISDVSLVDINNLNFVSQMVPWVTPYSKSARKIAQPNRQGVDKK